MDFNAAARSQPAQQGASGMRDAIEGTLDHWLPAAERLDFGAELLTLDTIIRPSMTAVALASTRGLSRCPALTPLYVKTAAQEASLSCWRVRKSLMTR